MVGHDHWQDTIGFLANFPPIRCCHQEAQLSGKYAERKQ